MIFRQLLFCATEGKQQSMVQLPQSCQEELIFFFSLFPWGFVVDVRTARRKPDRHVYFSFMAARLIKGTKQHIVCILLSFLAHGQRETLMRWEKCYMKTTAVVWPIKNVHFLNIIRRKTVSVYVCAGSHGDGGSMRACMCMFMYLWESQKSMEGESKVREEMEPILLYKLLLLHYQPLLNN